MRISVLLFLTAHFAFGQTLTWKKVRDLRDYRAAREHLANYLPDLAIPKIQTLLLKQGLDQSAKKNLLTLLGEAQVRNGHSETAIKTLLNPSLKDFSPAHLWRSYAYGRLGRYQEAIVALEKIDRSTMIPEASLQAAILLETLGDYDAAHLKLKTALKSKNPALIREAQFRQTSLELASGNLTQAEKSFAKIKPTTPREEALQRYLLGRIQMAKKQRVEAIGTFQSLLAPPTEGRTPLPSDLYHEATLALVDSFALENKNNDAATALLEIIEKDPNSPRLDQLFIRLEKFAPSIDLNPILTKLLTWLPSANQDPTFFAIPDGYAPGLNSDFASAQNFTSSTSSPSFPDRALYALHFIAKRQLQSDDPAEISSGKSRLAHLQVLATPRFTPLVSSSLLELGLLAMKQEKFPEARSYFDLLQDEMHPASYRAYANALTGETAMAQEDPTKASEAFLRARQLASEINLSELENATALNAGITLLATEQGGKLDQLTRSLQSSDARAFLLLERGLRLKTRLDPGARPLLQAFIKTFPDNPRVNEASLALAESALFTRPIDRDLALAEIRELKLTPEQLEELQPRRLRVLLVLGEGMKEADDFLSRFPKHPQAATIMFHLGKAYRTAETNEVGQAYITFEKFLEAYPEHELNDAARYLAALSALASGTESSEEDALKRFRELMAKEGPLASEATIALVSLLIDRDQQELAIVEAKSRLAMKKVTANDRRRLLVLAADAAGQLNDYEGALGYYKELLAQKNLPVIWRNRVGFHRGVILEKLGRKSEALKAYLSVVNRDLDPAKASVQEWKWFDKCGIEGALALLEREKRWHAAIKLAEKLGRSGSPRSADALETADRISLKEMIPKMRIKPVR